MLSGVDVLWLLWTARSWARGLGKREKGRPSLSWLSLETLVVCQRQPFFSWHVAALGLQKGDRP